MIWFQKSNFLSSIYSFITIEVYTLQTQTFALNNCDFIFFTTYKALHHISVLTQENLQIFIGGRGIFILHTLLILLILSKIVMTK